MCEYRTVTYCILYFVTQTVFCSLVLVETWPCYPFYGVFFQSRAYFQAMSVSFPFLCCRADMHWTSKASKLYLRLSWASFDKIECENCIV